MLAKPAYDDLIQGATALPALMAQTTPDGVPRYVPNALVDRIVGLTAVGAICASLVHRDRTGRGQRVDIPMFETMATFVMGDHMGGLTYEPPLDQGGYARHLSPDRRPDKTSDGCICVIVYNDKQWANFLAATGRDDLRKDPKFATFAGRATNIDHPLCRTGPHPGRPRARPSGRQILEKADVPVMPMHDLDSLLQDPHIVATDSSPSSIIRPRAASATCGLARMVGDTGRDAAAGAAAQRAQRRDFAGSRLLGRRDRGAGSRRRHQGRTKQHRIETMDFALSANQELIRDAIGKICSRFDDAYWLKKDKEGGYPADFHPRAGRCRLARHLHPRGIWRLGARHHRCRDHDADDLGIRRRHVGRVGGAHERVRAQSGGRVRHQGAMPAHAAAESSTAATNPALRSPSPIPGSTPRS